MKDTDILLNILFVMCCGVFCKNNILQNKYESCKRLESIMKKILINPNIINDKKVKLYDIEHPILKYINIIPEYYNTECDEIYNLMMDVNIKTIQKLISPWIGGVENVGMFNKKDKLILEFF